MKDKPKGKCSKCGASEFEAEKDVLDTWFTSSMTPRLSIELMDKKLWSELYPMSLRPQASEIITFWLFNTVVKSNLHYGKNPFKDVTVSGFVTLGGQKMSKSKGNVVEPQAVISQYGADAIRFWAAGSKLGDDIEYSEKEVVAGKKFVTKMLNAANFVFLNLKDYKPKKIELLEVDKLFLFKLNELIEQTTEDFEKYDYHKVKSAIDSFFWRTFCDYYLEIVKKRVYLGKGKEKESAEFALYNGLLTLIKLFASFTPFICEEVYQSHFKKNEEEKSIHLCSWPDKIGLGKEKLKAEKFDLLIEIVGKIRKEKTDNKKAMNSEIILTLEDKDYNELKEMISDLQNVTNSREIKKGKFGIEFL